MTPPNQSDLSLIEGELPPPPGSPSPAGIPCAPPAHPPIRALSTWSCHCLMSCCPRYAAMAPHWGGSDPPVHKGLAVRSSEGLPHSSVPGSHGPRGVRCPPHPSLSWALFTLSPLSPGRKTLKYQHTQTLLLTTSQLRDVGQVTAPF